jgi:hypothetical protein
MDTADVDDKAPVATHEFYVSPIGQGPFRPPQPIILIGELQRRWTIIRPFDAGGRLIIGFC